MAGCDYLPFGYTPVREITSAPGQFEGKRSQLKGRAKGTLRAAWPEGVTSCRMKRLKSPVVTESAVPAENSDVALKGIVKSVVIVGGTSLGLRVEETKRLR